MPTKRNKNVATMVRTKAYATTATDTTSTPRKPVHKDCAKDQFNLACKKTPCLSKACYQTQKPVYSLISPRIEELAKPIDRPNYCCKPNAFGVNPNALRYQCSNRIRDLAKPLERHTEPKTRTAKRHVTKNRNY